ncbi:MAG: type II toxin-antitoxin system VapC family toxin [Rhizomicrobium sp.]
MTAVPGSSVALKWFLAEPESADALAFRANNEIIAPDLVIVEVLNGLWKSWRLSRVTQTQVDLIAQNLAGHFSRLAPASGLAQRAAQISLTLDHPAYDCFYIALAEREGVPLVTADRRLFAKTRGTAFDAIVKPLTP